MTQEAALWSRRLESAQERGAAISLALPAADFQDFRSALLLPGGGAAVLDARLNVIRLFREDGTSHDSLSGPGVGGDRLRYPTAILVDRHGDLWALDASRTVKRFAREGSKFVFRGEVSLTHRAESFCVIGRNLVVRGRQASNDLLVHVYDFTGNRLNSFGEAYADSVKLVRDQLSRGIIGCDPSSDVVVVAYDHLPILKAYDLEGRLLWATRIPISPIVTRSEDGEQPSVTRDATLPFDEVTSILPLGASKMIVEVRRLHVESRRIREMTFRHLLLDVPSGSIAHVSMDSASYLMGLDSGRVLLSQPTAGAPIKLVTWSPQ